MQKCFHDFDVCVVGGGMAGICAAVSAARHGAKTALVHDRPVLGGNASSEIRMWICGAHGENTQETGILEEIHLENMYRNPEGNYSVWDSVLYGMVAFQPNLTLFLNCTCTGGEAEGKKDCRRITRIDCWQLTSQTWHQIGAKLFIDCSGDSILAPISGAVTRCGRESCDEFGEDIQPKSADSKTMGNSILIQLRKTQEAHQFIAPDWAYKFETPEDFGARIDGVYGHNFWWLEIGGLKDTISDAEKISQQLIQTAWGVWDYIKNVSPEREGASNWRLEWIGSLPGKRESRRYIGDHTLTQHDVRAGLFADEVAYGGWPMDDHHPAGLMYPGKPTVFHPAPSPYGIPYRSLYSKNVTNLLCAGRNISVTHAALSSTRVMATCALLGQAVGTAAAIAVEHGLQPRNIEGQYLRMLQARLMDDDVWLPQFARPISGLTEMAMCSGFEDLNNGYDRPIKDRANSALLEVGQPITLSWPERKHIRNLRIGFDSNLNQDRRMPTRYPDQASHLNAPASLAKKYVVSVMDEAGQWQPILKEDNNYQRINRVDVDCFTKAIRLQVTETWGSPQVRVFGFEVSEQPSVITTSTYSGPRWRDVVACVNQDDLRAPDSGLEETVECSVHGE